WAKPGFRLGLGFAAGYTFGIGGAPGGRLLGAEIHAGLRLDADWSLLTSFQYAQAKGRGDGLSGLRFAGTIDPTWHVTRDFALAIGIGFGGIVEGRTGRADVNPTEASLDYSQTLTNSRTPVPSCSGVGVVGLARATYTYVIGPRAATAVELEVSGQDTECVDRTGRVEPDSATPIERKQLWEHAAATLAWSITWR
ncbi:MAG TPA: hypothetical protein VGC41_02225, partial [Kofleriaceae bacterium]